MAHASNFLTKYTLQCICDLLEKGYHENEVCGFLGIRRPTYHQWKRWGEEEEEGIYCDFLDAVNKSKAVPYMAVVDSITKAIPTDPRLALEWMKIRYPKQLGKLGYPDGDDDPSIKPVVPIETQQITQTNILAINLQDKLLSTGLISQDTFSQLIKRVTGTQPVQVIEEAKKPMEEDV